MHQLYFLQHPCAHTYQVMKRGPKNRRIEELQKQLSVLEAKLTRYIFGSSSGFKLVKDAMTVKEEYLGRPIWEEGPHGDKPRYVYPDQDLIASLKSLREGLHLEDSGFGATVLAVLACGSRAIIRKSLFDEPSIYEVQLYCVRLRSNGLGIRFIQERGEHRRKRDGHKMTVPDELWKRAFWCLLSMDKPYDLDLPLEVDDEYWEHPDPDQAFKQPAGKPSMVTFFIYHIRLCELLGSALRRMYASNKSRVLLGLVGPEWEQRAVADLDSAMNEFIHSIPDHLRWDPNRKAGVFFDQSAVLHTMYYGLQITVHRPYILRPTTLALPSLAICTAAARSLINVVDLWVNRMQRVGLMQMHTGVFVAARAGLPIDVKKELTMSFQESRWQTAGRLWELLQELKSWDGPPPPKYKPKEPAARPPSAKENVIQETEEAGRSMFTAAPSQETSPSANNAPRIFTHIATNLGVWNDTLSSNPNPTSDPMAYSTAPRDAEMTIEQLLAATAEYDFSTGLGARPGDQMSSDTMGFANMMVDDDLLSFWSAAPTSFGNVADWDAYIENINGSGSSCMTAPGSTSNPPPNR
ncbi:hypothetical protein K438DRAFT_1821815 [Mycena galopus ATCC 62051]|nr:hypothetical protein K438DRAFT_1821815 [Mycena galopus ATCC 62051]